MKFELVKLARALTLLVAISALLTTSAAIAGGSTIPGHKGEDESKAQQSPQQIAFQQALTAWQKTLDEYGVADKALLQEDKKINDLGSELTYKELSEHDQRVKELTEAVFKAAENQRNAYVTMKDAAKALRAADQK